MARGGVFLTGAVLLTLSLSALAMNGLLRIREGLTCDDSSAYWGDAWCYVGSRVMWILMGRYAAGLAVLGLILVAVGWRTRAAAAS